MLEPEHNPNPSFIVDPPGWLRRLMSRRVSDREADATVLQARRNKAESRRRRRRRDRAAPLVAVADLLGSSTEGRVTR